MARDKEASGKSAQGRKRFTKFPTPMRGESDITRDHQRDQVTVNNRDDSPSVFPSTLSISPSETSKPSVMIVGAGRLGTALALGLSASGYCITALFARRLTRARLAASLFEDGEGARPKALSIAQLGTPLPPVDLILITTPDDAIAPTAARLAEIFNATFNATTPNAPSPPSSRSTRHRRRRQTERVVLHASGALPSDVLAPLRECGFAVGSMHPLASISEASAGAERLRGAAYCVEGDRHAVIVARRLVRDLGGNSFSIDTRDKALYHAAAVMTSGHMVALFDAATELLARCGLSAARARHVLYPLLRGTLENLATHDDPAVALTGPFARADLAIVRRHLAALAASAAPDAPHVYALLGLRSLRLSAANQPDAERVAKIRRALEKAASRRRKVSGGK